MITHHSFDCNPRRVFVFVCSAIELMDEAPAWIPVTVAAFCTQPHQTFTFICIITKSIQMTTGVGLSPH